MFLLILVKSQSPDSTPSPSIIISNVQNVRGGEAEAISFFKSLDNKKPY